MQLSIPGSRVQSIKRSFCRVSNNSIIAPRWNVHKREERRKSELVGIFAASGRTERQMELDFCSCILAHHIVVALTIFFIAYISFFLFFFSRFFCDSKFKFCSWLLWNSLVLNRWRRWIVICSLNLWLSSVRYWYSQPGIWRGSVVGELNKKVECLSVAFKSV